MESRETRRIELLLPIRTVLIVAVAIGLMAAFIAIGSTFLIIFVGIFLALVFEYPVRLVMAKTRMSRGLAATSVRDTTESMARKESWKERGGREQE